LPPLANKPSSARQCFTPPSFCFTRQTRTKHDGSFAQITFECLPPGIEGDLEWKLTYVGSASSDKHDQVLDTVLVGPVVLGVNRFVFVADPPDVTQIPLSDVLEVTVVLLTCSYREKEFIRIGYYVITTYEGVMLEESVVFDAAEIDSEAAEKADADEDAAGDATEGDATGAGGGGGGGDGANDESKEATAAAAKPAGESKATKQTVLRRRLPPDFDPALLRRELCADEPRVTRFMHTWDAVDDATAGGEAMAAEEGDGDDEMIE
jgi:hypothetical protein